MLRRKLLRFFSCTSTAGVFDDGNLSPTLVLAASSRFPSSSGSQEFRHGQFTPVSQISLAWDVMAGLRDMVLLELHLFDMLSIIIALCLLQCSAVCETCLSPLADDRKVRFVKQHLA